MRGQPQDLSGWTWTDDMGSVAFPAGMSLGFSQFLPPAALVGLVVASSCVGYAVWNKVPGKYTIVAGLSTVIGLISFAPKMLTEAWGAITLDGGNHVHRLLVLQIGMKSSTP